VGRSIRSISIAVKGTALAPIRIVGSAGTVLTRSDNGQNTINLGSVRQRATSR
jgi:hypothetical protein